MKNKLSLKKDELFNTISKLIIESRNSVVQNINYAMLITYFFIGKNIVEDEQKGEKRADYAKKTLSILSKKLTKDFGKGFSVDNLERIL